jgi:hypothetical protein
VLNEVLIYIQMGNDLSNINFLRVMSRELWLLLAIVFHLLPFWCGLLKGPNVHICNH